MSSALVGSVVFVMAGMAAGAEPVARIELYNPTGWDGATVVEVPVGRVAAPGLIPWDQVRLVVDGREVPFAIREGRPHWKADLIAPIREPRAEDLLVFACAVPPGEWVTVGVVPGAGGARLKSWIPGTVYLTHRPGWVSWHRGVGELAHVIVRPMKRRRARSRRRGAPWTAGAGPAGRGPLRRPRRARVVGLCLATVYRPGDHNPITRPLRFLLRAASLGAEADGGRYRRSSARRCRRSYTLFRSPTRRTSTSSSWSRTA